MQTQVAVNASHSIRILLAEDDDEMRALLLWWLRQEGYHVTPCYDGNDLLSFLEWSVLSGELAPFDLVLSDIRMPRGSALSILDEFGGCGDLPPTILITAFGEPSVHAEARRLGAVEVIDKPLDREVLMAKIRRLVQSGKSRELGC
jgi:DNA-binding response OmpR family regulator